ncbi:hypothetical protein ANN_16410, partial [Periplaneta americana]
MVGLCEGGNEPPGFLKALKDTEEGRREDSEMIYQVLQEIIDKINKNDYILLMEDLNARMGNQRV